MRWQALATLRRTKNILKKRMRTEGINSAIKVIFGEQLSATSERGMLQEAACKVWAYQRLKRYGET